MKKHVDNYLSLFWAYWSDIRDESIDPYHTDLVGLMFSMAILLTWCVGMALAFSWRVGP